MVIFHVENGAVVQPKCNTLKQSGMFSGQGPYNDRRMKTGPSATVRAVLVHHYLMFLL